MRKSILSTDTLLVPLWSVAVTILALLVAVAAIRMRFAALGSPRAVAAYFAESPQPMWVYNPADLRFLDVNATALATYGYTREAFLAMTVAEIEPDMKRLGNLLSHLGDGTIVSRGWRHRVADGRLLDVDISSRPIVFNGVHARIVIAMDVTERVRAEELLRRSETTLEEAQQLAHLGSFYHDLRTNERRWSDELYAIFGMTVGAEKPSEGLWCFDHPDERERIHAEIDAARRERRAYDLDHRIVRADGEVRSVHERGRWKYDEEGAQILNVGTIVDITDRKNAEEALARLAYHDPLTGLPNRAKLIECFEETVAAQAADEGLVALIVVDIDRFKVINDTLGHGVGDDALLEVAARLTKLFPPPAVVARQGGDEFVIFAAGIAAESDASDIAQCALTALKKPFVVAGHDHFISASAGVALGTPAARADELLQNAETAMYSAKAHGGNSFRFYTANLQHVAAQRFKLEGALHRAIDGFEFSLYYQPVLSTRTGRVVAAEALLRWNDPMLGLVMPANFIEFAEETGLIRPIGAWAFDEALRQAKHWTNLGHALKIWVNVSAAQLHDPSFVPSVRASLARLDLPAACIGLELTESSFIDGRRETIATLRELKTMGFSLALDDFGVAYSSLDYVRRLPIDTLKIDRSFLHDIRSDRFNQSIVRGIVGIAHDLRLKVTAEGVETKDQLDFLTTLGCDDWQGFHFAQAVPARSFERFLDSKPPHALANIG